MGPTYYLFRLMRLVCKSNNAKLFLQLKGVAMGSRSSLTFACIFVGMLEVMMLFGRRSDAIPIVEIYDDVFTLLSPLSANIP